LAFDIRPRPPVRRSRVHAGAGLAWHPI